MDFLNIIGADNSMSEYAKMTILLAFNEYPNSTYEKAKLVQKKFEEKYNGSWSCSFIKEGDFISHYSTYFLRTKPFKGFTISIWKN